MSIGFLLLLLAGCAGPPSREIVVAMDEFVFLPNVIEVAPGERVRLTLRNIGRLEHDFVPDERGRAFGVPHFHLPHGAAASRDWTAPARPDELAVICGIAGHREAGMVARIVVR